MLAAAQPALAQKTGPNGGLSPARVGIRPSSWCRPTELTVYILDHGKAHDTKGVKIRAVIQEGGKTTNVDLAADDGKKLVGKLAAPLGKGAIVVLTGKDDHGDVISARYVVE